MEKMTRQHRRHLGRQAKKKGLSFDEYVEKINQEKKLEEEREEYWKKVKRGEIKKSKRISPVIFGIMGFGLTNKK